ncbi:MAG TPA: enoyl-CoA hydratase-related protein [Novosphingobium sp.]|nr:enoyl-CoA hydratase-related protein [Novosphingobium sp.]
MSGASVLVSREGALTLITINRPEAHNALNPATQLELMAALDAFEADDGQWVAILTGAGEKAFCGGMDLKHQAAEGGLFTAPKGFGGITERPAMTKPVIAAVNGIAMGGGFEMALACDIIVAAAHAVFALPEPRVGLAALAGGIQRLPAMIGLKQAMGLLLTGRRVSAAEGLRLGFVNEVAEGDVLAAARAVAQEILACSPLAVRATKEAALRSLHLPAEEAIAAQWQWPAMAAMLASEDAVEGPRAFAEKRRPAWRGR